MKNEELTELEKIMRAKLEQKEFEFKDSYWQELNKQRGGGKRTRLIYWFISLLALLGTSVVAFSYLGIHMGISDTTQESISYQEKIAKPQPEFSGNVKVKDATTENEDQATQTQTVDSDKEASIAGNNKQTDQGNQKHASQSGIPDQSDKSGPLTERAKQESFKVSRAKTTGIKKEQPVYNNSIPVSQTGSSNQPDKKFLITDEKKPESADAGSTAEINDRQDEQNGNTPPSKADPANQPGLNKLLITKNNQIPEESVLPVEVGTSENRKLPFGFLQVYLIDAKAPNIPKPSVNECDTCMKKIKDFITYKQEKQPGYFTVVAGANYFTSDKQSLSNLGFTTGINYLYPLRSNIYVGAGLLFSRVRYELPVIQTTVQRYGFGLTVDRTWYKTTSLDYVEIPLELGVCFNKKHYLTAGMAYNQLISAQTFITKSLSGERNQTSGEDERGKPSYIRSNDFVINAGYRYYFNNAISVAACMHWGLFDITNNAAYRQSEVHNNRGFKIMLGYKLSR